MSARELLFELRCEELPPHSLASLAAALAQNILKGLDNALIAHGQAREFATPRRLAVSVARCALRTPDRNVERRGPPLSQGFDAGGRPTQAAAAFARIGDVDATLASCSTGRELIDRGFRSDVQYAAEIDVSGIIPVLLIDNFPYLGPKSYYEPLSTSNIA